MFVYSADTVRSALSLAAAGKPSAQIASSAGISVRTVRRWRADQEAALDRGRRPLPACGRDVIDADQDLQYAYLLGLYLGDGHIANARSGTCRLDLTLDAKYPCILEEARSAVQTIMPANKVSLRRRRYAAAFDVGCYSRLWPVLFPQHGPGRKHERLIALQGWQAAIAHRYPGSLIRGLIHSDGCRYIARQRIGDRVYPYARYGFTNRSADILRIFCDHLDLLRVRWTISSPSDIQIARREAVARLDQFVGPKR